MPWGEGQFLKRARLICDHAERTGTALIAVANPFELELDCGTLTENEKAFVEHAGYRLLGDSEGFKNKQARQRERLRELGFINMKMEPIQHPERIKFQDCFIRIPANTDTDELIRSKFGEYFVRN